MRTYIRTEITLNTIVRIPYGYANGNTALFICRRTRRCGTIYIIIKCRYWQTVAFLSADLCLNIVHKINDIFSALSHYLIIQTFICTALPALWNFYLHHILSARIDCRPVLLYHVLTFTAIGLLCGILHQLNRLLFRNNTGQLKECGL